MLIGTEARKVFDEAISLCRKGQNSDAASLLDELTRRPTFSEEPRQARAAVHGYLGGIYLHSLDDPGSAEWHYRKSSTLSPRSERASLGLFHSLIGQRRVAEALEECRRFLEGSESAEYRQLLQEVDEVP